MKFLKTKYLFNSKNCAVDKVIQTEGNLVVWDIELEQNFWYENIKFKISSFPPMKLPKYKLVSLYTKECTQTDKKLISKSFPPTSPVREIRG